MRAELGDKVRDRISGLTGIVTARTEWIHGCVRVNIQPQEVRDGKPVDPYQVDEPQLELLERGAIASAASATPAYTGGGDRRVATRTGQ